MAQPKRHHHVPQFLLSGWCRGDGRLAVYSNRGRRVVVDWHTPEHTAFASILYEIAALPKEDRQWVERELVSKAVDDPASKILKRLLAGELKQLNSDDRTVWTRFILAQWWRSPEVIGQLRREGRSALLRALEANPGEYLAARGEATESTLAEWVVVTEGVKNRRSVLEVAHETGLPVEEVLQREIDLGLITSSSATVSFSSTAPPASRLPRRT